MSLLKYTHKIGKNSIKEGLDNLPCGICFADRNGMIVLCNRQMYRLCYVLTGADLQHISELFRGFDVPQHGVTAIDRTAFIYRFPDHSLWQFSQQEIADADGNAYTQVQAVDVTELHEKIGELEQETQVLEETNARARKHYAALDQIVLEEETLAMKMRVHDDIGRCLLSGRNLLMQGGSLEDYKKSGERWAQTVSLMEISCQTDYVPQTVSNDEVLSELIRSAQEIGIHVTVQGSLPSSKDTAYLMIVAMRECATNAVRHANASEMTVKLLQTQQVDIITITNNGDLPHSEIIEGGGLSSLRHSIESKDGTMLVEGNPKFQLTVTLPRKEEAT